VFKKKESTGASKGDGSIDYNSLVTAEKEAIERLRTRSTAMEWGSWVKPKGMGVYKPPEDVFDIENYKKMVKKLFKPFPEEWGQVIPHGWMESTKNRDPFEYATPILYCPGILIEGVKVGLTKERVFLFKDELDTEALAFGRIPTREELEKATTSPIFIPISVEEGKCPSCGESDCPDCGFDELWWPGWVGHGPRFDRGGAAWDRRTLKGKRACPDCEGTGGELHRCGDHLHECVHCKGRGIEWKDNVFGQYVDNRGKFVKWATDGGKNIPCRDCGGSGLAQGMECPECKTSVETLYPVFTDDGWVFHNIVKPCETCNGSRTIECDTCGGSGDVVQCPECGDSRDGLVLSYHRISGEGNAPTLEGHSTSEIVPGLFCHPGNEDVTAFRSGFSSYSDDGNWYESMLEAIGQAPIVISSKDELAGLRQIMTSQSEYLDRLSQVFDVYGEEGVSLPIIAAIRIKMDSDRKWGESDIGALILLGPFTYAVHIYTDESLPTYKTGSLPEFIHTEWHQAYSIMSREGLKGMKVPEESLPIDWRPT